MSGQQTQVEKLFFSFLIVVIYYLICPHVLAQSKEETGYMKFSGTVKKYNLPMADTEVLLYMDGDLVETKVTRSNGKFRFKFEFQHEYVVRFSHPGHVEMRLEFSTKVPASKLPWWPEFRVFNVPLVEKELEGVNTALFEQKPFTKISYDPIKERFSDDRKYLIAFEDQLIIEPEKEKLELTKRKENIDEKRKQTILKEKEIELAETGESEINAEENKEREEDISPGETSTETEEMKLLKEKEDRKLEINKNKAIKTQYDNDLLKIIAESEKKMKKEEFKKLKNENEQIAYAEKMDKETEVKIAIHNNEISDREMKASTAINRKVKSGFQNELAEAVVGDERETKKKSTKNNYLSGQQRNIAPQIIRKTVKERFKIVIYTTVNYPAFSIEYKEVVYVWGMTYYFKNEEAIEEETYRQETAQYLAINEAN